MRLVVLLTVVGILIASLAMAETVQYTEVLYPRSTTKASVNWIGLRGAPIDFIAEDVDNGIPQIGPGDPQVIFGAVPVTGVLTRLDAPTNTPKSYDPDDPSVFGNLLLGVGYKINISPNPSNLPPGAGRDGSWTISYAGIPDGIPSGGTEMTDVWVSLPGRTGSNGGVHWVSTPFDHDVWWPDVKVTDGNETIPVWDPEGARNAVDLGWIEGFWTGRNAQTGSPTNIDPDDDGNMHPGKMYLVKTHKSNIALIIPAYNTSFPHP